jgi:hypothetical protein
MNNLAKSAGGVWSTVAATIAIFQAYPFIVWHARGEAADADVTERSVPCGK